MQTDSDQSVLIEFDQRSVDSDMVELENSVELLVCMHPLAKETGNALEVYTNDQDDFYGRQRKTAIRNCIAIKLCTLLLRCSQIRRLTGT